ncbi:hypothetical protein TM7_0643 [candidate division TM7 genomosp. GTL1]|nr:hypothetical protein TM7_0643 [candidate division TM7 genomosp. GTL1]
MGYMTDILSIMGYLETGLGKSADQAMVNAIMLIITVLPLFSLPFIMKAIGGIASSVGGFVNNRGKGIFDRTRNLGRKASSGQAGAWKGYLGRKGTEYGANNFNPNRRGLSKIRNVPSMVAARKMGVTRRQGLAMGRAGEAYEAEEIKLAQDDIGFKSIGNSKERLAQYVEDNKGNVYAQIAAMKQLAEVGGDKELSRFFNRDDTKVAAAKSIRSSSKMKEAAAPLYFESSGFIDNYEQEKAKGTPEAQARAIGQQEGDKLRERKAKEDLSQQYVLGLKPVQVAGRVYNRSKGAMEDAPAGS